MPNPRVLTLHFDPERLKEQVRPDRWEYIFYHLRRILEGQHSDEKALEYYGITWVVEEDMDQGNG